ncbi:hypothetical protein PFISCL1PPCAC_15501 [Pristionchus fissidentatus]|uniref:Uncharacterized protein n=1 Tax=Pristionchus fissidentatus TaxID=1538716 RepID=A0AAV5W2Q4_9BILA|nr:hypothetical protein PFISCL1PPCAC_15501 [Pristionchus fissidentatus]
MVYCNPVVPICGSFFMMLPHRVKFITRFPSLFQSSRPQSVVFSSSHVSNHMKSWVDSYEEFIGVRAVKDAQSQVMKWEERLSDAQLLRRDKQSELKNIHLRLKEIHLDMDRTARGEDKHLELLKEEHATMKMERMLLETLEDYEIAEREAFHQLSIRVRESHEKERERVEKTKWWSVSLGLAGSLLGVIGSSIGNHLRMKKMKEIIPASQQDLKEVISSAEEQQEVLKELLVGLTQVVDGGKEFEMEKERIFGVTENVKVLELVREENTRLLNEIRNVTRQMKMDRAMEDHESVVYVGSHMERLLDQTEKNIESKMKLQTLISVVFLYSALGLTVPILWALFSR